MRYRLRRRAYTPPRRNRGVVATKATAGATPTPSVVTATASPVTPTISTGSTVTATVVTATASVLSPTVTTPTVLYPVSKSGRKWLDQNGDPIQIRTLSSWGLLQRLSTANITTAVQDAAAQGFNALTVDFSCGMNLGSGWTPGQNLVSSRPVWTGTAFQSTLGSIWTNEVITLMDALTANGMYAIVSCYAGNGSQTTTKAAMVSASTSQMRTAGQRWATALSAYNNWVIHYGLDDTGGPDSKFDALVQGIEDIRGDILCVGEPNQSADALAQWSAGTFSFADMEEAMYQYDASHVSDWVLLWRSTYSGDPRTPDGPTWDCEPLYVGHSITSPERLEKRYRQYALPIEGAIGINNGHEDWWTFGATGVGFTAGDTWPTSMANTIIADLALSWQIWDLVNTATWEATTSFVTTGAGSTGSTAAQGTDGTRAIAYFPNNRTVQVDTTILTGSGNVRLRWFDPTDGSFSTISASEAQQTGRSVTLPAAHADTSRDFVLVVDLLDINFDAAAVTATASVPAPTVTAGSTAAASVVTATVSVPAPTVSAGSTATPTVVTASVSVATPSITAGGSANPTATVVTASASVLAPTVTASSHATPTVVTASVSVPAPTASGSATATATVVTATSEVSTPSVTAGGSANVNADVVTAVAAVLGAAITAGSGAISLIGRLRLRRIGAALTLRRIGAALTLRHIQEDE